MVSTLGGFDDEPKNHHKFLIGDVFVILQWHCTMITYLFIERFIVLTTVVNFYDL